MGQRTSITSNNQSESDVKRNSYADQLLKRSENVDFDVEGWYPILQNETFYTEFIPISPSVAQSFVNFYQTRYMSTRVFNLNDLQSITSIQDQLKERIFNHGTFVRLSSRSPKDGKPLDSQTISQIYHQKFNELQTEYPDEDQSIKGKANMQMIAYCYAQFHSLKVTNETQALNLLLSSERVHYDLIEALDCEKAKTNEINWNNHIILRQWNDRLDPSMEFRCFIYQSKLTAISQYDYYCKYYHLQDQTIIQQIKRTIIQYWKDQIQPRFDPYPEKYSNYVIDIGLMENKLSNEYDCIVIEMNPFATTTGGSLFHWTEDQDQLKGKGNDAEIRIQLDYYPYIEDYIECILEANQCNGENHFSDDHPGKKPYFIVLDQMKAELTS